MEGNNRCSQFVVKHERHQQQTVTNVYFLLDFFYISIRLNLDGSDEGSLDNCLSLQGKLLAPF